MLGNGNVAAVDENGVITAKAAGTAKITVYTHNNKKAVCTVTVKALPQTITVSALTLGEGMTGRATTALPAGTYSANLVTTVSDPAIAEITADGTITAKQAGTTEITVTCPVNGVSGTALITVLPAPTEDQITLSATELTIAKRKSAVLSVSIAEDCMTGLTFTSSNPAAATVSAAGKITATKKAGTTVITVTTSTGVEKTCTVTVK